MEAFLKMRRFYEDTFNKETLSCGHFFVDTFQNKTLLKFLNINK